MLCAGTWYDSPVVYRYEFPYVILIISVSETHTSVFNVNFCLFSGGIVGDQPLSVMATLAGSSCFEDNVACHQSVSLRGCERREGLGRGVGLHRQV